MPNGWDGLTMGQKSDIMAAGLKKGLEGLDEIKKAYDSGELASGGKEAAGDGGYSDWTKALARYNGVNANADRTYDYRSYYNENPEAAWTALGGEGSFPDKYRTAYHPLFSSGSVYSGVKDPKFNPDGLSGGEWAEDGQGGWDYFAPNESGNGDSNEVQYADGSAADEDAPALFAGGGKIARDDKYRHAAEIYQAFVDNGANPQVALELVNQKVAEKGWSGYASGDNVKFGDADSFAKHVIGHYERMYPDSLKADGFNDFFNGIEYGSKYKYNPNPGTYRKALELTRPGVKRRVNEYRAAKGEPPLAFMPGAEQGGPVEQAAYAAYGGNLYKKGGKKPSASSRQRQAMDFYQSKGLSRQAASGLVGNFTRESNLNPNAVNPNGGAYGIAQWLGPRKQALFAKYGPNPTFADQLAFSWDELNGTHRNALRALQASRTPAEAAKNAFGYYEFSAGPQAAMRAMDATGKGTRWNNPSGKYAMDLGITNAQELFGQAVYPNVGGNPWDEGKRPWQGGARLSVGEMPRLFPTLGGSASTYGDSVSYNGARRANEESPPVFMESEPSAGEAMRGYMDLAGSLIGMNARQSPRGSGVSSPFVMPAQSELPSMGDLMFAGGGMLDSFAPVTREEKKGYVLPEVTVYGKKPLVSYYRGFSMKQPNDATSNRLVPGQNYWLGPIGAEGARAWKANDGYFRQEHPWLALAGDAAQTAPFAAIAGLGATAAAATGTGAAVSQGMANAGKALAATKAWPWVEAGVGSYFGAQGVNDVANGKFTPETALDLMSFAPLAKPVYKSGKNAANAVKGLYDDGALWDKYTTFRGRFGNYSDNVFTNMYATAARRFGLPDKARVPADAMRKIRLADGEVIPVDNGMVTLTGGRTTAGKPHMNATTDRQVTGHSDGNWDSSDGYMFPTQDFISQTLPSGSLKSIEPSDMFSNGVDVRMPANRTTLVSGDPRALKAARGAGMQTLSSPRLRRMYNGKWQQYQQDIAGTSPSLGSAFNEPKRMESWQEYADEINRLMGTRGTPTLADYRLLEQQTGLNAGVAPIAERQRAIDVLNNMLHTPIADIYNGTAKQYVYPNGRAVDWDFNSVKKELGLIERAKYNNVFYDPATHVEVDWKLANGIKDK